MKKYIVTDGFETYIICNTLLEAQEMVLALTEEKIEYYNYFNQFTGVNKIVTLKDFRGLGDIYRIGVAYGTL